MPSRSRLLSSLVAAALAWALLAVPAAAQASAPADGPAARSAARPAGADRVLAAVRALPGVVRAREVESYADGYRLLRVVVDQPVDHRRPGGARFTQRVDVLHRGLDRPTVLVTEGYAARRITQPAEPTLLLDANQVSVEHRGFGRSVLPGPRAVRRTLTIRQAADDVHRVVRALQRVYERRWVSTGASKSGMAAVYHRRFHPGDVDATVAYVAPDDVVDDVDAYAGFLAEVGTATCRDAIVAVQRRVLGPDRAWFLDRTRERARAKGWTWRIVGSAAKAWEAAVVETSFAFFQYQRSATACPRVPGPDATREQVFAWYGRVSPMTTYADQRLRPYVPYYVQAAAQLGAPTPYEAPVADLLRFPGTDVPLTFVPPRLRPRAHDDQAMADVDRWVRTRARRTVFVYGGDDPWSAEPFTCGTSGAARGCTVHVVAGGDHSARVADLPAAERRAVRARLLRWAAA